MIKAERDRIIERCAAVIDQCNREGPFQAIAGAKRIRALKDESHAEGECTGKILNQTCSPDERRCGICGFEPDWRVNAERATGG
jgi:hypothetical protein